MLPWPSWAKRISEEPRAEDELAEGYACCEEERDDSNEVVGEGPVEMRSGLSC